MIATLTERLAPRSLLQAHDATPSRMHAHKQTPGRPKFACAPSGGGRRKAEKDGRIDTVILSAQQFEALKSAGQPKTLAQRKRAFEQTHKAWIDELIARFEQSGLWCDDPQVW